MGHVHFKGDYAAPFSAPASVVEDEASVDREIARMARGMRMHLRVPKPVIWALLASLLGHSAVAIAVSATQIEEAPEVRTTVFNAARTISLDWDLYAGGDSGAAAPAEESPELQDDAPVEVAAIAPTTRRSQRPEPTVDAAAVVEEDTRTATASPVEALVDDGQATQINVPAGEQIGSASRNTDPQVETATGSSTSQHALASAAATTNTGANRSAGATGDGHGVDLEGIRRGHIASLNRAIRSKNPCTRELSHRGLSGDVVLGLTQASDGRINEVRVMRSSGEALIDEAARSFILSQTRLPRPDSHLTGEVWQVGLRFKCGT